MTLEHLKTFTVYKAFMMVSTSGGSRNGSTITFEVEPFGRYHFGHQQKVDELRRSNAEFIFVLPVQIPSPW